MRTSPLWSLAAVSSLVVAAACGGGQAEPVTPTTPSASASETSSAAPAASASAAPSASASAAEAGPVWKDDMTKDQKVAYMKANIVPRMAKVFKEHDATKYAEFGCKTCHGPQHKAPKDFLPKLTMKGGNFDKPEMAKWMHEKVVPEMAAAMGEKPYDPATKTGFGCMECHTIETK
jgi:hypothetical protein